MKYKVYSIKYKGVPVGFLLCLILYTKYLILFTLAIEKKRSYNYMTL